MTNEELNTALYEKMFAEQEKYRAWLLSQPPEEILNHTYEYTMREDGVSRSARRTGQSDAEIPQPPCRCICGLGAQRDRPHG